MLRKEEFPKEPIEILKDVLPSEEFKKLASLNQERLRCMAEADGLMGEVEVRAYQAGLRPLRKEYPEQCHPSNKLVEAFKRYSRACWELL